MENVVESGEVVVAELKKISFVRLLRTFGGLRSSGRRMSGGARSSGAWAKIGHGKNNSSSWRMMVERSNSSDFVDGKGWRGWGKLDPHVATQIHGSNPTKLHHTNKSQKKIGAIFVGQFSG